MKNLFRKITAVLLVTILLALSLPLQSFAISLVPKVEKIEVNESSQAVSLKEMDTYFEALFDMLEENEIDVDFVKEDMPSLYEILFSIPLYSSNFEYKFDVTLDSGKEYTVSASDGYIDLNKIYTLEIGTFITYDNYLKAKENGADEVQVKINAELYSNLTNDYVDGTEYTSTDTLPVVDMYVKSITPVSGIPERFYYDADYVDVEGAEFAIEYADGETVTATVKSEGYNPEAPSRFSLNGKPFYAYDDLYDTLFGDEEKPYEISFEYLDAYYTMPAEHIEESLFRDVKITDCVLDTEKALLNAITYELTYADGETVSFTKKFTEAEDPFLAVNPVINSVDGYDVMVYCSLGGINEDGETINADTYHISVYVGDVSDTYDIENPNKDIMNGPLNAIHYFINMFIKIQEFFTNILSFILFGF